MRLDHLLSKEKCFQERKHISVRQELSGIYCSILKVPILPTMRSIVVSDRCNRSAGILKKGIGKPEARTQQKFCCGGVGSPSELHLKAYGGVAQLGEHLLCKQGVRSSILLISTRGIRLRNELEHQSKEASSFGRAEQTAEVRRFAKQIEFR